MIYQPTQWYHKNKHRPEIIRQIRSNKLKNRYGISLIDYEELFNKQNGLCKICGKEKELHVDHSHKTGEVRGLLCHRCNNGLGCFDDSPALIQSAIAYLGVD